LVRRLQEPTLPNRENRENPLLRIIETFTDGIVTIQFHGRLAGAWLDEARSTISKHAVASLRLDLTELRYADAAGIELLRSFQRKGIHITSHSPYSTALVEDTNGR
jgi:anti-anti-sigma regulatory factor